MEEKDFIINQLLAELANLKVENIRLKFKLLQKEESVDGSNSENE